MQPKDNRKQSHNLSKEQIEDLKYDQIDNNEKMITANRDSNEQIPSASAHLVHARIEARQFDQLTGKKLSTPLVQIFYPDDFDKMEQEGAFKGQTVEVIHDPRSVGAMTSSKIDEAAKSGLQGQNADKPLDEMDKAELLLKYADLYKEEAPKGSTLQSLRDAIEDKLVEIRGPQVSAHLNEASESGKGDLNDGVNKGTPTDAEAAADKTKKK